VVLEGQGGDRRLSAVQEFESFTQPSCVPPLPQAWQVAFNLTRKEVFALGNSARQFLASCGIKSETSQKPADTLCPLSAGEELMIGFIHDARACQDHRG
jgi:hypothetical protein